MTTVFIWVTRVIRVTSAHCSPLALILIPAFSSVIVCIVVISVVSVIGCRVMRLIKITRVSRVCRVVWRLLWVLVLV
jgi:hypothetical protein